MKRLLLAPLFLSFMTILSMKVLAGGPSKYITSETFKGKWPLLVESGILSCQLTPNRGVAVIFEDSRGKKYAVNGTATAFKYGKDIEPIWKPDPEYKEYGLKISISDLIEEGQKLCSR